MKVGETVICINNENKYQKPGRLIIENLTLNKKYVILNTLSSGKTGSDYDYDIISVHNDNDEVMYYDSGKFITIEEHRNIQLEKLLKKENNILNFLKWI